MTDKVPVSVVVLTKNEEGRLARCLDSVKWADELIVVDDESADRTTEVARVYTERVLIRRMDVEGTHRNWAYAQARNQWVLSLDADEVITPELAGEIADILRSQRQENGFTIPRRNFIGSYWVRSGGWYPSPQLRLFRRDKFKYEEVAVHPRAFMDPPCGHLKNDMLHYSFRDLEDMFAKLNNQTTREAQKWYNSNKPMRLGHFIWRAVDRFFRSYLGKKAWKDGYWGFVISFNAALYQVLSYLKYRELARKAGQTS